MELKTKVNALEGEQQLTITREFELPVDLLFRAYVEAEIIEQWMNTKVLKLESKKHGSFLFETSDPQGNKYRFNGSIHECVSNQLIVRTFEFENTPFGVQLETLAFQSLSVETSLLTIQSIFQSVEKRDQQLKMPFAMGLNMAHNRLQEIFQKH